MNKLYVQYGCGLSAPESWINFDASPTLRIQKTPVLSTLLKRKLNVVFPPAVKYGDIIKGLPVPDNSCDAVYCSHILEHLSLNDFRIALKNTLKILKRGGTFRCVVPDLEFFSRQYLAALEKGDIDAGPRFIGQDTLLGLYDRPRGIKGTIISLFGNSHHLWMWDYPSLSAELSNAGFKQPRRCTFNDSPDEMFLRVEEESRFTNCLAIECFK